MGRSPIPRRYRPTECTLVGMLINALLMVVKITAGFVFRSAALVADGAHSFADLVSDLTVLLALRASKRPPDSNHPYGHESFETLGAIAVALFMIATGVLIGRDAVMRISSGDNLQPTILALVVALLSIAVKEALARYTLKAARLTNSPSLWANGRMHRADAMTSAGAATGILGAMLGILWLDSLGALVIAFFVLIDGIRLSYQHVMTLLDTMPDSKMVAAMHKTASRTAGVLEVRDLKVRQRGSVYHADLRVAVDPHLTVDLAHDLAHDVVAAMRAEFSDLAQVLVHVEPHHKPPEPDMPPASRLTATGDPDSRG
jgi:cation diffusion facilitator family transporter